MPVLLILELECATGCRAEAAADPSKPHGRGFDVESE
jgi:hypothetical protein